uniref:Uncharacterized protein n=1 Tax=Anopheles arabiensis TaxID=7173 RepID=A0A182IFZ3_ANOAR
LFFHFSFASYWFWFCFTSLIICSWRILFSTALERMIYIYKSLPPHTVCCLFCPFLSSFYTASLASQRVSFRFYNSIHTTCYRVAVCVFFWAL